MSKNPYRFYGKYRGKVFRNKDPDNLGRITAKVPGFFGGGESNWATPSLPYAGRNVGFFFMPPIGASVWMEFEGGDTKKPVWSGCFWDKGEAPRMPTSPEIKVLRTEFATLTFNDTNSPSIVIQTKTNLKISMNSTEIEISTGDGSVGVARITLRSGVVSVNEGALEVHQ
jgi:uncharacterized protein involved in type VI secretion and phage assembly